MDKNRTSFICEDAFSSDILIIYTTNINRKNLQRGPWPWIAYDRSYLKKAYLGDIMLIYNKHIIKVGSAERRNGELTCWRSKLY